MLKQLTVFMVLFAITFNVHATECGKVTIADMNWDSATFVANVDSFILQHGFGCETELVPSETILAAKSILIQGKPDIIPEMWRNALKGGLEHGIEKDKIKFVGKVLHEGGLEGFWVPAYMVEKEPSLATIAGVKQHSYLFKRSDFGNKQPFFSCAPDWRCQNAVTNLFNALDLKQAGFELTPTDAVTGLSGSIAHAYAKKLPWIGYYWSPTAVLGNYKMVRVDFNSGVDREHFRECIEKPNCKNPQVTMFPPRAVDTIVTLKFAQRAPEITAYLSARRFSNQDMNNLMAWKVNNNADGEQVMAEFLNQYEAIWIQWVSPEVAAKVKGALADL
ncbi:glycine betaine ABC transporter substrate-binding protein [Photobacterium kishitanii]|uniref:glycine betaine ABC transporter substrate-binding protein n=1 Tax=Photobacterium kishitanii TaxID=318456 RepID=UPI0004340594|nr:glycine betaine ABC transporter substrate-binding protein [Photobacterium kishitanii]CEO41287.1 conserved exported hypothetical protein [Photobacterium kishitanii]